MNQSMFVWCVIAGMVLLAFVLRIIGRYVALCNHNFLKSRHLFEMANEREMFYVPGDEKYDDESRIF